MELNCTGFAKLYIQTPEGEDVPQPAESVEQDRQIALLDIHTEHFERITLAFRRGDLAALLAKPNSDFEIEVAVSGDDSHE